MPIYQYFEHTKNMKGDPNASKLERHWDFLFFEKIILYEKKDEAVLMHI